MGYGGKAQARGDLGHFFALAALSFVVRGRGERVAFRIAECGFRIDKKQRIQESGVRRGA